MNSTRVLVLAAVTSLLAMTAPAPQAQTEASWAAAAGEYC